jgi:hypothetical protein
LLEGLLQTGRRFEKESIVDVLESLQSAFFQQLEQAL